MAAKLWNLKELSIVFGAIIINGNYSENGALEIEKGEGDYGLTMSADGVGSRFKTNNGSATMRLKLMQTSDANAKLSALRALGILAPNGADVAPFLVRDRQGTSIYSAETAWIEAPPNPNFEKAPTERIWTLRTDLLLDFTGGN